jgi:hypothetical protein
VGDRIAIDAASSVVLSDLRTVPRKGIERECGEVAQRPIPQLPPQL